MSTEVANATSTALAIASSAENVGMVISKTPAFYSKNQSSHDNCLTHCRALLDTILAEGMNDELDQQASVFIERSKKTVKKMNELRSPVTKIFDQVRAEFTKLENEIDPSKSGTVPYQLQQLRNQYADKKRKEEEEKRRKEEAKRQLLVAKEQYYNACYDDYKSSFNDLINTRINELTELNGSVTLENIDSVYKKVKDSPTDLPADWCPQSSVRIPLNLPPEDARGIRADVMKKLMGQFTEQYRAEVGDWRQDILDKLPSKKTELERAAKASAEEKARIEAQMKLKEQQDLAKKEQERLLREQEEAKKVEVKKASSEAAGLFDLAQAAAQSYQPKTKVTKKIQVTSPNGYLQVMMMWWAKEGCNLSKEELDKIFKKQIAFCEKVANKEGEFIQDPTIQYVEEVKAQ